MPRPRKRIIDLRAPRKPTMNGLTIVFDLDGTLVDSAPDLIHATNHTLGLVGLAPVPGELIRATVSHGARAMIAHGLALSGRQVAEPELDELLVRFLDYYRRNIAVESRPFPAAVEVLGRLKAEGSLLAVCTNKTEALARQLLGALEIDGLFQAIVGRDTLPVYKPDPGHLIGTVIMADGDLGKAVMVGDSEIDVRTAKTAGIPVVGVSFGYTPQPIGSFEPDAVIDHYDQLEDRIAGLVRIG